jgi:hypothetical protein
MDTGVTGLGTLPLQAPDLAVKELRRCVQDLGLAGVQIGTSVNEWSLDAPELFPVFQACRAPAPSPSPYACTHTHTAVAVPSERGGCTGTQGGANTYALTWDGGVAGARRHVRSWGLWCLSTRGT